jgi:hypothetical protein
MGYYDKLAQELREKSRELAKESRDAERQAGYYDAMAALEDAGIDWELVNRVLEDAGYAVGPIRRLPARRRRTE